MGDKSGELSRRERRKEARLEKNKKKFESWVQHQSQKSTKLLSISKPKGSQSVHSDNQIQKREVVALTNSCDEDTNTMLNHSLKQDFTDSIIESQSHKRKRGFAKKPKNKFEKYLKMEMNGDTISSKEDLRLEKKFAKKLKVKDGKLPGLEDDINMLLEGVPSVFNSLDEGKSSISFQIEDSTKKRKKRKPVNKRPSDEGDANDNDGGFSHQIEASRKKYRKGMSINEGKSDDSMEEELDDDSTNEGLGDDSMEEELDDDSMNEGLGVDSVDDELDDDSVDEELDDDSVDEELGDAGDAYESKRDPGSSDDGSDKHDNTEDIKNGDKTQLLEKNKETNSMEQQPVKYIAPHLRSRMGSQAEEYVQIRRRIRGLLNRMSESNVESITAEMSTIFHSIGRSMGSQIIGEEVLTSCSGGPRGNEQYAAVFSAFVAGMACMVGIDFGAKLLASLAKCFEDEYSKDDNLSLRNLTLLLSYLYTFGVCSSDLIYDFLMMLCERLTEVDVSTILTVLQACGMRLRSDDPVGMKNFILNVNNRVNELKDPSGGQSSISSKRMEFMLETICDIKNNKAKAKEDTVQQTRMKKWLQKQRVEGILLRGLSWSKLLDPSKKGQWWLSGDIASATDNIEEVAGTIDRQVTETQKMLQLAAAQRMNTDARRAIFCIIMSADDYIDAFEKLLRLDLRGKQDREIMRVLVDCCLQEKAYNKYYRVLASKLCSHDKNHKFTLQYCLWDRFKDLESMQLISSRHLAKFVAEMVTSFSISLAVLKVVDLSDTTQLTPKRIMHFRLLFESILELSDKNVWNVFSRISVTPEYEPLRTGIELFVNKYVIGHQESFKSKFKIAKKALNNVEGILM